MVDDAQVRAYAGADFAEPHDHMVALLRERFPDLPPTGIALDLGCGAGDIARRFATALPGWRVHGIDGSRQMLQRARDMTEAAGLAERVTFDQVRLPATRPRGSRYDIVFSNSLLHHLADPGVFWSSVRDWAGAAGRVFVMDLLRPPSREVAEELVRLYAAEEPEILQTDFFNSLLAAFEAGEIEVQLELARLGHMPVEVVSDRHCIVWGIVGDR